MSDSVDRHWRGDFGWDEVRENRGRTRRLMLLLMRGLRRNMATVATWVLLAVLCVICLIALVEGKQPMLAIAAIAGFVATLQLRFRATAHRGQFVSEYLTRFYLDDALWSTYNELIYRYTNGQFKHVNDDAHERGAIHEALERIKSSDPAKGQQIRQNASTGSDGSGCVRYHPLLFQYTEEESRLDALFGYLRVVDYNSAKGLIGVGEIYSQLGTFLLTMWGRDVVQAYIRANDLAWRNNQFKRKLGVDSPMRAAKNLFDCVRAYDDVIRFKRVPLLWPEEGG